MPVAIQAVKIALSRHISFQHGRRSTSTAASRQQVREGAGLVLKFFLVIPFLCRLCRRLELLSLLALLAQCFGRKKTAVAVALVRTGSGQAGCILCMVRQKLDEASVKHRLIAPVDE